MVKVAAKGDKYPGTIRDSVAQPRVQVPTFEGNQRSEASKWHEANLSYKK